MIQTDPTRNSLIYADMDQLNALVEISRHYGSNPDYIVAGGGNTSFKNERELYVKASGVSLAAIGKEGFVKLSREKLGEMERSEFPTDPSEREVAVKLALGKAVISPRHLRPSVETSLHNLIGYPYIVHTHPTLVNAVMCASEARKVVEERFGNEALYLEYTDPGYTLFKGLQGMIRNYEKEHRRPPKIIFLQNHGVFVGADSVDEIKALYESINARIAKGVDLSLPPGNMVARSSRITSDIAQFMTDRNLLVRSFRSPLTDCYSSGKKQFLQISRPYSPDIIVYCKSNYLFMEQDCEGEQVHERLKAFETNFGYLPRVIVEEKGGLIIAEEDEKAVKTVLEVFHGMMKISYLSEQFGGPHFLTDEQIAFIDSWEVENYRRSVARENQ
jgi:rhamnose utilization protein RhaD (predicted bifunctional aldolase and dehydrogenase)